MMVRLKESAGYEVVSVMYGGNPITFTRDWRVAPDDMFLCKELEVQGEISVEPKAIPKIEPIVVPEPNNPKPNRFGTKKKR